MLVPTKFTTLEESTIFKMLVILKNKTDDEKLSNLLIRTSEGFQDTSEFLHALDILYVLGLIDFDSSMETIKYVN
ncbi:ABC-three component system middle component 7 [Serratia marcescens]|uniref:ABC-three component system middle component 7 n=2 Tax=Gammaproteobacteria TaxID=1236 RepID=UPI003144D6FB